MELSRDTKGGTSSSRLRRQLRCGVSRPAPRRGLSSQRGASSLPGAYSAAGEAELLLDLRTLSPPSRKISEFSTRRSAIAVAMVVLKRMLPQSENGVLVVMMVERFWL